MANLNTILKLTLTLIRGLILDNAQLTPCNKQVSVRDAQRFFAVLAMACIRHKPTKFPVLTAAKEINCSSIDGRRSGSAAAP